MKSRNSGFSENFLQLIFKNDEKGSILAEIFEKEIGNAWHLVNAYSITLAYKNPELMSILREDSLICDSAPLSRVLKFFGTHASQLRGVDLARSIIINSKTKDLHFLIVRSIDLANEFERQAKLLNPSFKIAGKVIPPFVEDHSNSIPNWVKEIEDVKANIVWVGLGTPKQDFISNQIVKYLDVQCLSLGAALDYVAKTKREAGVWLQNLYLEWLFRLMFEPSRLWRRYLIGNIEFIMIVIREKIRVML